MKLGNEEVFEKMAEEQSLYRIIFAKNDQVYELYAKYLSEESLMGFIEIEELVFSDVRTDLLVDTAEEKLRNEFKDVKRSYIPLHTILRIDEVKKEGEARIVAIDKKNNVSQFPGK